MFALSCETKPICGREGQRPWDIVRNKAKSQRKKRPGPVPAKVGNGCGVAYGAEQSQTWEDWGVGERWEFCAERLHGGACETKPIPSALRAVRLGTSPSSPPRAKQSQFLRYCGAAVTLGGQKCRSTLNLGDFSRLFPLIPITSSLTGQIADNNVVCDGPSNWRVRS
jgi:hypothetical protein